MLCHTKVLDWETLHSVCKVSFAHFQLQKLQGCLTAFFAKEDVTWACPAEGKLLSRAQSSREPGQELASPSMDLATPETREKLKRRRYAAALKKHLTGWHTK